MAIFIVKETAADGPKAEALQSQGDRDSSLFLIQPGTVIDVVSIWGGNLVEYILSLNNFTFQINIFKVQLILSKYLYKKTLAINSMPNNI